MDEADKALSQFDWEAVRQRAQAVLRLDPQNRDALAYLAAAQLIHGLCDDQACEACVGQAPEITDAAYQQGKLAAMEDLDQWLIMAGGEELRQKIIEMAARGKQLYEHS